MFHPPERDRPRERDRFDPIREGARHGLSAEQALAIWKRASDAATDSFGRCNEDQARAQFQQLARGRGQPDPGRRTRVELELEGPGTADELVPRVPGRQTLVDVEARREPSGADEVARRTDSRRAGDTGARDPHPAAHSSSQIAAVLYDAARAGHLAACVAHLLMSGRSGDPADATLLVSAVEPSVARTALSLLRHLPGASRLLASPAARDEPPAHLRPMPTAGAVASPRRSFARAGFVSRDVAADASAREASDLEPALVDQGGGEPLPPALAARMAELLHHDFTHVRLHTDASATRAADALGARAFTLGEHIYFNRDQFTPETLMGERLLLHELTHVVQYDQGRLPRADGRLQVSDPEGATEREARAAEARASHPSPKPAARGPVPMPAVRTTAPGSAATEIHRAPQDSPPHPEARVAFVREDGLSLRAGPDQKAAAIRTMKFGQRVHILDGGKGEWLKIAVLGQTGYASKPRIHFPPKELIAKDPGLTLIKVKPHQTFWGLVKDSYGIQGNEGPADQNINHFINAIRAVNKPEAFKVKTDALDDLDNALVPGRDASETELTAGVDLWIPSFGVAAQMDVGSGTVTGEVTRYARKFKQKLADFAAACRASGKYIPGAIGRNAGDAAMGMLQGLIEFAIDAAKILAVSTAVGAVIGSFFGGVGAVPGAEIGFELGMLILEYYGLYMLVEAVLGVAGKLLGQLGHFIALAWGANGDKAKIEEAGQTLADALGLFVSAILVVIAAYLMKRGVDALGKTKFAQKVGQTRLAKWLEERQKGTTSKDPRGEKAAKEKAEQEKAAKEKAEKEKAEQEKAENEKAEREKAEREKAEQEKAAKEKADKESATSQATKDHVHEGDTELAPHSPYYGKWNGKGIHDMEGLKNRCAKDGYRITKVQTDPKSGVRRVTIERVGKDPKTGAEVKGNIRKSIYPKTMTPAEIDAAGESALKSAANKEPNTKFDRPGQKTDAGGKVQPNMRKDGRPADGYFEASVLGPDGTPIRIQGWFNELHDGTRQITSHAPTFKDDWPSTPPEDW